MTPEELDTAIEELEQRLDRLRGLYDQYFMGIERIEPAIARKDVDRRLWVLRRTQIRNTAKRFKLQTLIQRYNLFQQHWQRTCRDIENGTYKRHLQKVQNKYGADLAKVVSGHGSSTSVAPGPDAASGPLTAPAAGQVSSDALRREREQRDLSALPDEELHPEAEVHRALDAVLAPPRAAGAPAAAPAPAGGAKAQPPGRAVPLPPRQLRGGTQESPRTAGRPRAAELGSLDFDMDALGLDGVAPSARVAPVPQPAPARLAPGPQPAPARSPAPVPGPASPSLAEPSPPPLPAPPARPLLPGKPPLPARPPLPGRGPVAPSGEASVGFGSGPVGSGSAALSGSGPAAPARTSPAAARPAGDLGRPAPPAAARPMAAAARPEPARAAASAAGLSDEKVREIHERLMAEKRKANDPTGVSFEGLAKSLRAAREKLLEQHAGRPVDFQVVVKDGKPVVRPVLGKSKP